MLLRPETALLVVVLAIYLAARDYRRAFVFAASVALVLAALMVWHSATASERLWVHLSLNIDGTENAKAWLASRPAALYGLLLQMDRDVRISVAMLAVFAASIVLMMKGEATKRKEWMAAGVMLLGTWTVLFQYRLWSDPAPPVALLGANSLLATLPWVFVLARPPYRGRPALWLACAVIALTILLTPVWKGVHWGPRIVLFALPLLLLDLKQAGRARGVLFTVLLGVTSVQSASSMMLVYAQNDELAGRYRQLRGELGSVVICPGPVQCADLAPLWNDREFFTADTPRELKQLMIEFRRVKVDTCWLHLKGSDSLYASTFPEQKPVRPLRVREIEAGSLYHTRWRIYTLVLSAEDTAWTGVLQAEAGTLMSEGRPEKALDLQRQAVELSPQSAQVHHNLALIYSALGETTEARAEVRRALEIDSTLTEARLLSADLSRRSGGIPAAGEHRPDRDQARPPD
jgi:tetratricopeptide (TPR) repeat protein